MRFEVEEWIKEKRPEGTASSYLTYRKQFLEFCSKRGFEIESKNADVFIAQFLRARAEGPKGLAAKTLLGPVMGAIADIYRFDESPPQKSPLVVQTKKVVKKIAHKPSKAKPPLSLQDLRRAVEGAAKNKNKLIRWRDICMLLIMYTALLRQSEVVNLKRANIAVNSVFQPERVYASGEHAGKRTGLIAAASAS